MTKKVTSAQLDEFLGNKAVETATDTAVEEAGEQAINSTGVLDGLNGGLQGGNQTLTQLNELIGNVAKITENIQDFLSPKSEKRKSSNNSDYDQNLDAFGQPTPPDISRQAQQDYTKFAKKKQDDKKASKNRPPEKLPSRAIENEQKITENEQKITENSVSVTKPTDENSDFKKEELIYAWFGAFIGGVVDNRAEATVQELREEYTEKKEEIIDIIKQQIVSV